MSIADRYKVWVYSKDEDGVWSIPDEILVGVWKEIVADGRNRKVFYAGGVLNAEEWLLWLKSPFNYPCMIVDTKEKKIVFVAWLNSVLDRICFAHFCGVGKGTYIPEIPRLVMSYWASLPCKDDSDPYFRAIFGLIPETNGKAVQVAKDAGFTFLGVIPGICNLHYENRFVGGNMGYFIPPKGE